MLGLNDTNELVFEIFWSFCKDSNGHSWFCKRIGVGKVVKGHEDCGDDVGDSRKDENGANWRKRDWNCDQRTQGTNLDLCIVWPLKNIGKMVTDSLTLQLLGR